MATEPELLNVKPSGPLTVAPKVLLPLDVTMAPVVSIKRPLLNTLLPTEVKVPAPLTVTNLSYVLTLVAAAAPAVVGVAKAGRLMVNEVRLSIDTILAPTGM